MEMIRIQERKWAEEESKMEGVRKKKKRDCMMGVSMVIRFLFSHAHRDCGSNISATYQHPPFSFSFSFPRLFKCRVNK